MNIIFATGNKHKLQEAQQILGPSFSLKTSAECGITEDIPETADTLKGNAIQKAMYIWDRLHVNCFADDTGLEIDAAKNGKHPNKNIDELYTNSRTEAFGYLLKSTILFGSFNPAI